MTSAPPTIPNPITANTDANTEIYETIDNFFLAIRDYVSDNYKVDKIGFQIDSYQLARDSQLVTDNRIMYVSYRDIILANVLETRTISNYIRFTFSLNLEALCELQLKSACSRADE